MLKEIYEQPELIQELVQDYIHGKAARHLAKVKSKKIDRFLINACGTAYYAGLLVVDYLELINKIQASAYLSSEFRYRNPLFQKNDAALFISQSGETADTLAAAELAKENNIPIYSLVNVRGSTLYRLCDQNLLIKAGTEIGVASTKAFTQMALTGRLMAASLGGDLDDESKKKNLEKKFLLLSERINDLISEVEKIKEIAESLYNKKGYLFTGRGIYYPVALEGALKLKEIAYVHAEGYASGELKHGPIALIDEEMVNIAVAGPELLEKTISNIQEVKARKGIIVTIGPENNKELMKISDYYIPLNFNGLDELSPIYVNVVHQLLSYYMAKFKGNDIDQPRNLAKSVTVE
jgi:glucosamine--fructose-6-phosphate aminotransferase (isomerizing)